ncbi:hypothetical protein SESBI_10495 [Sesbania bispinosa]|nr:hypothetical protein SESBI_10495 [Sesbania bispinosa]
MVETKEPSTEEMDLLARSTKKAKVRENGSQATTVIGCDRKSISYRDICLGKEDQNTEDEDSDSSDSEDSDYEGKNGDSASDEEVGDSGDEFMSEEEENEDNQMSRCPVVKISKEERKRVCRPWKHWVIVKLLGKKVGLKFMLLRLEKLWCPLGEMEVIDLENDYFLIRFPNFNDFNHVFEGGPWIILGHYLVIQKWHPEFLPFENELRKVVVWIRIPSLLIEYYDRQILARIGDSIGRTVKTNAAANAKKDVRNLVQKEKNVAENPNTTGSRFSALAENPQVVEELESAEGNPIKTPVQPHVPSPFVIEYQDAMAQSSEPKGTNTKVHQPNPNESALDPRQASCPQNIPNPSSLTNIKKPARGASKLGQENPQNNTLMTSSTPQQHIPIVHPITIPHANFIKTGLRVDDGVYNRRPPDPNNGKVDPKKVEESSAMSIGKEVEDVPPQMEIDPAMENQITDPEALSKLIVDYFTSLFTATESLTSWRLKRCFPVLRHKYAAGNDIMPSVRRRKNQSLIWKGIVETWWDVLKGTRWIIGDGTKTRFWLDPWLKSGEILHEMANQDIPPHILNAPVSFFSDGLGGWNFSSFQQYIPQNFIPKIMASMGAHQDFGPDFPIWAKTSDGEFTTKSAYSLLHHDLSAYISYPIPWDLVWKWNGPQRICCFL